VNARERIVMTGSPHERFEHREYPGTFVRPAYRLDPTPANFGDTAREIEHFPVIS